MKLEVKEAHLFYPYYCEHGITPFSGLSGYVINDSGISIHLKWWFIIEQFSIKIDNGLRISSISTV